MSSRPRGEHCTSRCARPNCPVAVRESRDNSGSNFVSMQVSSLKFHLKQANDMRDSTQTACKLAERTLAEFQERMSAEVQEQGRMFQFKERELLDQLSLLNEKHMSANSSVSFVQEEFASAQRQLQQAKVELASMEEKCHSSVMEAQEARKEVEALRERNKVSLPPFDVLFITIRCCSKTCLQSRCNLRFNYLQDVSKQLAQACEESADEIKCIKRRNEQELEALQQQVCQLQDRLQARSHAADSSHNPRRQDDNDSRVLGLQSRVRELEDANETLENALLRQYEGSEVGVNLSKVHDKRHRELLAALEQRDAEIEALSGQLRALDAELVSSKAVCHFTAMTTMAILHSVHCAQDTKGVCAAQYRQQN